MPRGPRRGRVAGATFGRFGPGRRATGTTKWWVDVSCSNGTTRTAGPYTTFQDVCVYCPPNTLAQQGWVSYG